MGDPKKYDYTGVFLPGSRAQPGATDNMSRQAGTFDFMAEHPEKELDQDQMGGVVDGGIDAQGGVKRKKNDQPGSRDPQAFQFR